VNVLRRPKFGISTDVLQRWLELIQARTVAISPPPVVEYARDPKDAPFLAAAIQYTADFLITGDKDLLAAQPLVSTRVVTAAEFATLFQIE
jgi:putative PIN family toxin of toxin-antitoxin system